MRIDSKVGEGATFYFTIPRKLNHNTDSPSREKIQGEKIFDFLDGRGVYQERQACPRLDLIFMDIRMPKTDGITLLKQLKANPDYQTIPVIMLTSSRHGRDVSDSYRGGASAYLQKPVSYQEFVRVIDCLAHGCFSPLSEA